MHRTVLLLTILLFLCPPANAVTIDFDSYVSYADDPYSYSTFLINFGDGVSAGKGFELRTQNGASINDYFMDYESGNIYPNPLDTSSGHLANGWHTEDSYIYFDTATTVNSFQLNGTPWENHSVENVNAPLLPISVFDSSDNLLWYDEIDLHGYFSWDTWLTVNLDVTNARYIKIHGTPWFTSDIGLPTGLWPSLDNLVINETPEPGVLALTLLTILLLARSADMRLRR